MLVRVPCTTPYSFTDRGKTGPGQPCPQGTLDLLIRYKQVYKPDQGAVTELSDLRGHKDQTKAEPSALIRCRSGYRGLKLFLFQPVATTCTTAFTEYRLGPETLYYVLLSDLSYPTEELCRSELPPLILK